MALLFADSFDHYTTSTTTSSFNDAAASMGVMTGGSSTAAIYTTHAHSGARSVRARSNSATVSTMSIVHRAIPDTMAVGVTIFIYIEEASPAGDPSGMAIIRLATAGGINICNVILNDDRTLSVYTGPVTTSNRGALEYTTTQTLPMGQWVCVEATFDIAQGIILISVNGDVIDPALTFNLGASPIGYVAFGRASGALDSSLSSAYGYPLIYMDDWVAWTPSGDTPNTFMGPATVVNTLFPDADFTAEWTPSTGSDGYPLLAKNSQNDATYIQADLDGNISEFGIQNLPSEVLQLYGVAVVNRLTLDSAGAATVRASLVNQSSVDDGADALLTDTETRGYYDIFPDDPATGLPWDVAGFNTTRLRLTRTS